MASAFGSGVTKATCPSLSTPADNKPKVVFFKGDFVPYEDAKVSVLTHGLNYGTGCFEGIRGYWNEEQQQMFVLTTAGVSFGYLLSGSFVVETVFTIPGVGEQSISSLGERDYSVIQGTTLLLAVIFVGINLLTDLLYAALDPRVKAVEGAS